VLLKVGEPEPEEVIAHVYVVLAAGDPLTAKDCVPPGATLALVGVMASATEIFDVAVLPAASVH